MMEMEVDLKMFYYAMMCLIAQEDWKFVSAADYGQQQTKFGLQLLVTVMLGYHYPP
jgi:hypothetical protein